MYCDYSDIVVQETRQKIEIVALTMAFSSLNYEFVCVRMMCVRLWHISEQKSTCTTQVKNKTKVEKNARKTKRENKLS